MSRSSSNPLSASATPRNFRAFPGDYVTVKTLRILCGALLAAALAVGATATPAFAHANLIKSSPKDGTTVAEAPKTATLTFSEKLDAASTKVAVTNAHGDTIVEDKPAFHDDTMTVPLALPGPGRYTIGYHIVSRDGHPVEGEVTFTAKSAPKPGASVTVLKKKDATASDSNGGFAWGYVAVAALAIVLAGILYFGVRRRRQPPKELRAEVEVHVEVRHHLAADAIVGVGAVDDEPEPLEHGARGAARVGVKPLQPQLAGLADHGVDQHPGDAAPARVGVHEQHVDEARRGDVAEADDAVVDRRDEGVGSGSGLVPRVRIDGVGRPREDLPRRVVRRRGLADRVKKRLPRRLGVSRFVGPHDERHATTVPTPLSRPQWSVW
jgi:methionine-rich copper-binding protein CopC